MSEQSLSNKILNICIVFIIIVGIVFTAVMCILNYDEKGETNMPFQISKITVISSVDGQDVENSQYRWSINAIQNNDIYIYLEKNDEYKKQQIINSVILDNFNIAKKPNNGEVKIYKPVDEAVSLFKNIDENIIEELKYTGSKTTNSKKLEISNQGGVIALRCANDNIGIYTSNDEQEINYKELIKKMNIKEDDLKIELFFDITIKLDSGKAFKAENIKLELPNHGIVEKGTVGYEYTNIDNIIFKRIEN